MRQHTAWVRAVVLAAALALMSACGGEEADPETTESATPATDQVSPDAGEHVAGEDVAGEHIAEQTQAAHGAGTEDHQGGESAQPPDPALDHALVPVLDPALAKVAAQTASALSGSDWGLVWDLSCGALRGDQSREVYAAALSAAGSPGQLAGGTLTVGSAVADDGVDTAGLAAVDGEVRWVEMRSGDGLIGIARFVDAGEGFRYCGLSV